jgi:hypothetical protein
MILIAFRIGLCFLPDSPRWLVMRGRHTEARHLLARLADAPVDSEEVDTELTMRLKRKARTAHLR